MEDSFDETTSSVEIRHRKEKKELQAQIQALKKSAKNDKTKKKELTTEIARLETEQEMRHKKEIEEVQSLPEPPTSVDDEGLENDMSKLKVSKAQKRRDKKHQQEKEREQQIKIQEKENLHGPRIKETQAIDEKLKKKKLKIFLIPSDGDCLYKAVGHQLETIRNQTITLEELRKNTAVYMQSHKEDFLPFTCNPDTDEMLTEAEFEDYCDKIVNTKVWGGQLEIRALSNSLKCPIYVVQATGPDCIEQGTEFGGSPLIITYHRHMYSLGEHYNSTSVVQDSED